MKKTITFCTCIRASLLAACALNTAPILSASLTQPFTAKKLTCPQVRLLNMVLEENPIAIVRSKMSCARAAKAIQMINDLEKASGTSTALFANTQEEQAFINGHLKLMLEPVRQFLDLVREHKSIVKPVITESLAIASNETQKSWLLKFIETQDDVHVFFDKNITTTPSLKQACSEFITVFGDITESLSEKAKSKCDALLAKLQQKK